MSVVAKLRARIWAEDEVVLFLVDEEAEDDIRDNDVESRPSFSWASSGSSSLLMVVVVLSAEFGGRCAGPWDCGSGL